MSVRKVKEAHPAVRGEDVSAGALEVADGAAVVDCPRRRIGVQRKPFEAVGFPKFACAAGRLKFALGACAPVLRAAGDIDKSRGNQPDEVVGVMLKFGLMTGKFEEIGSEEVPAPGPFKGDDPLASRRDD